MASPSSYADQYLSLTVPSPADDGKDLATGISVGKYLLTVKAEDARYQLMKKVEADFEAGKKANRAYALRIRVLSGGKYETHDYASFSYKLDDPLYWLLRYPFGGKGSPEAVQAVLQVASTVGPSGKAALVQPAGFQKYCDDNLGTDCSGFVGNFLRHEVQGKKWWEVEGPRELGPQNQIDSLISGASGAVREGSDQVLASDLNLLAEVDDATGRVIPGGKAPWGHTGISEPGLSRRVVKGPWFSWLDCPACPDGVGVQGIWVVESTGEVGLARSWYLVFDHPKAATDRRWKGVFRMYRGVKSEMRSFRLKAVA